MRTATSSRSLMRRRAYATIGAGKPRPVRHRLHNYGHHLKHRLHKQGRVNRARNLHLKKVRTFEPPSV